MHVISRVLDNNDNDNDDHNNNNDNTINYLALYTKVLKRITMEEN